MPSLQERTRNNVRTGIFVTITLAMAICVVVVLSGSWDRLFRNTDRYVVTYPISAGVTNLSTGADVRVGGIAMGAVAAVDPAFNDAGRLDHVAVTFDIDRRVTLYEDAAIYVEAPLIGSDAWLSISAIGADGTSGPQEITGTIQTGLLSSLLGPEGAENTNAILDETRATMENLRVISNDLPSTAQRYDESITAILANIEEGSISARDVLARVKDEDWPAWSVLVHKILRDADAVMIDVDKAAASIASFTEETESLVEDARPKVENILANIDLTSEEAKELAEHLNAESLVMFDNMLARAAEGIDAGASVLKTIGDQRTEWSLQIGEALANANLTAQRLKLTSEEIRRNPWKILHRPTDAELEHELLYSAARSFALATADLRLAAEATKSLLERHGDALDSDEGLRERLENTILGPLERYESAQERMIMVLFAEEEDS